MNSFGSPPGFDSIFLLKQKFEFLSGCSPMGVSRFSRAGGSCWRGSGVPVGCDPEHGKRPQVAFAEQKHGQAESLV